MWHWRRSTPKLIKSGTKFPEKSIQSITHLLCKIKLLLLLIVLFPMVSGATPLSPRSSFFFSQTISSHQNVLVQPCLLLNVNGQ